MRKKQLIARLEAMERCVKEKDKIIDNLKLHYEHENERVHREHIRACDGIEIISRMYELALQIAAIAKEAK